MTISNLALGIPTPLVFCHLIEASRQASEGDLIFHCRVVLLSKTEHQLNVIEQNAEQRC